MATERSAKDSSQTSSGYRSPVRLAMLENTAINESSGLVASRVTPGLLWTHNDTDREALLYRIDRAGKSRGIWRIPGVRPFDWEDIAAGPGPEPGRHYLYLGDTGDNYGRRREIIIYRIPEPVAPEDAPSSDYPQDTEPPQRIALRYPAGVRDAETLLVHPTTGDVYIITKQPLAPAEVYRAAAPLKTDAPNNLVLVAKISLPNLRQGFVTGGDISPDGRRVAICDHDAAYEFILPAGAQNFDAIWQTKFAVINLNKRKQGEAICYRLDGRALLTTSEGVPTPLDEIEQER